MPARTRLLATLLLLLAGCPAPAAGLGASETDRPLDRIARDYVALVLAAGRHDQVYVDAYFGPPELEERAASGRPRPPSEIAARARRLASEARSEAPSPRRDFLVAQLEAVEGFARRLAGEPMTLAQEALLLFGIDAPRFAEADLEQAVRELDLLLPGAGTIADRISRFRQRHQVRADRLEAVAELCIEESRARTRRLVELPEPEAVELELVHGAPWDAYLWYLGGYRSRIELEASRGVQLGDVCRLMIHEGYPGHHTFSVLLEERAVRGAGRVELAVYPLYSPLSVIMEGTAELAYEIIFTRDEWSAFLAEQVAPAAGLDGVDVEAYLEVQQQLDRLRNALLEASHRAEEGAGEAELAAFLARYAAVPIPVAREALAGESVLPASYIFTYTVGKELVERHLGEGPERTRRYFELLESPAPPAALSAGSPARRSEPPPPAR